MEEKVFCENSLITYVIVKLAQQEKELKFYDAYFKFDNDSDLFYVKSMIDEQLFLVAHHVAVQYIYIQVESIFKGEENEKK